MLIKALLIGLVGGFGILDGRIFGLSMLGRPLVLGPIVGLILGDLQTGIIVGGTLELIWMGIVGIGAALPPDIVTGGVLGTTFAILSGQGPEVALTLAIPIAMLAQSLGILVRTINSSFMHKADSYAEKGDIKGVARVHWVAVGLFFLNGFLPSFLAVLLGANIVEGVVNSIPPVITDGLSAAAGIFPAIGFALLLKMILKKKLAVYYLIGFVLSAYLGLDIIGIAIIGTIIAIIVYQLQNFKKESGGLTNV